MSSADELLELLRRRRSVRRFTQRPVPPELLDRIVRAGTWAPSGGNRQQWEFTVVADEALKRQMASAVRERWASLARDEALGGIGSELAAYAGNFDWFASAPVVLVVSAREPEAFLRRVLAAQADDVAGTKTAAAMAAQNILLAARALGLGSCCLTGPLAAEPELKRLAGLAPRRNLVCLIALGYPADEPAEPPRKPLRDVMRVAG